METFNQELTHGPDAKLEVSSTANTVCEQASDESSPSSPMSLKREYSSADLNTPVNGVMCERFDASSLPPRKRAKTQEEKEQRRVERIMRNRQAAHASREKKRKYLESLESKCSSLESENSQLKVALSQTQSLRSRIDELEVAIKLAKSTGDVSHLNTIKELRDHEPVNVDFDGTVTGSLLDVSALPIEDINQTSPIPSDFTGSPAPSLVEDCASPEALAIKKEEDDFFIPAYSDHSASIEQDPFEVLNFSFDTKPAFTLANDTENSSKSRHPAAVTYLQDNILAR